MSKQPGLNQTARASLAQAAAQAAPARAKAGGIAETADSQTPEPLAEMVPSLSAEGAALRLEKRTHFETGRYRIQLTNYGNGLGEIGWSFVPSLKPNRVGKGESKSRALNESRASRRARSRLRRLILGAGADHLLTLTYRENVTDFDQSSKDFCKFIKRIRAELPGWVYIAVAENQKRGAWHWHIAVRGRQDVNLVRSVWRQVVGEGNIDVRPPRSTDKNPGLSLINYLSKYLGKGFQDGQHELNARRFRASHGIQVPCTVIQLPDAYRAMPDRYAINTLKQQTGSVGFIWISPDLTAGWACSWK